jgi:hypothetical protein
MPINKLDPRAPKDNPDRAPEIKSSDRADELSVAPWRKGIGAEMVKAWPASTLQRLRGSLFLHGSAF